METRELNFRPFVVRRTMAHELFFMSTSTFEAACATEYPPLEGRLVGESLELLLKAMDAIIREPEGKIAEGHQIATRFERGPTWQLQGRKELHLMIKKLWPEWEHIEKWIDEDVNPPQARYGASSSRARRLSDGMPISGGTRCEAGAWVKETNGVYDEFRDSVGNMIWENWPTKPENERRICIEPAVRPGGRIQPVYPQFRSSLFGWLLCATQEGNDTGWRGIIPIRREAERKEVEEIWVRVRVDEETAVDQKIRYIKEGIQMDAFKWAGPPKEGVVLQIYEALSVVGKDKDGTWKPVNA